MGCGAVCPPEPEVFPGVTVLFCVPCCVCGGAADGLDVSGTGVLVGSGVGDGSGVGVGSGVAVGAGDALEVILEIGSESWMSPGPFCVPAIPPTVQKTTQKAASRQILAVLLSLFILSVFKNQMDKETGQKAIARIQNQTGYVVLNEVMLNEPFVGALLAGGFCAPAVCCTCCFAEAAARPVRFSLDGFFLDVCALDSVV